jgi:organic hydroperoxide reductase OsmC/OhrA
VSGEVQQVTMHSAAICWAWGNKDDIRAHEVTLGQQKVPASCQESFGGDPTKADPEKLFVAAVAGCHMLWFLDFARRERLRCVAYEDQAEGTLDGDSFSRVVLRPRVEFDTEVEDSVVEQLHHRAHGACFIANSIKCPVDVELWPDSAVELRP